MRVHPGDVDHFTAPQFAVLIEGGLVTDWPHEWTRAGVRSVRRATDTVEKGFVCAEVIADAIRRKPAGSQLSGEAWFP